MCSGACGVGDGSRTPKVLAASAPKISSRVPAEARDLHFLPLLLTRHPSLSSHTASLSAPAAAMRQTQIFSGNSHPSLVEGICERLGQRPGKAELRKFSNGETSVQIRQYESCSLPALELTKIKSRLSATRMSLSSRVVVPSPFVLPSSPRHKANAATGSMIVLWSCSS